MMATVLQNLVGAAVATVGVGIETAMATAGSLKNCQYDSVCCIKMGSLEVDVHGLDDDCLDYGCELCGAYYLDTVLFYQA